ncbi:MAG: glycosyltransferase [Candidatus ainarchaeum sp.]|nr:glycosyltransferase [Candidatus ainarchaeum sp.]
MKVLFNTSPGAFENPGGGEIQLLKTKAELEKLGFEIELFDGSRDIADFDLLHNFNIHRDTFPVIRSAFKKKVPVAISTIYWPSLKYSLLWNRGTVKKAKAVAAELINRLDFPGLSSVKKNLRRADILLPNSEAEARIISGQFGVPPEKIAPICNGVDERFAEAGPEEFEKKFGFRDFVLYAGRIEERKNVLSLVRAMKNSMEKLVIMGNAKQGSEEYALQCRQEAGKNTVFLEAIPHESGLLESAYAACKVFALPSWYETPGLAALEAGLAGANIVVTKEGCTKEYFGEFASYADPASITDIEEKISSECAKQKTPGLQKRILGNFLWKNTAEQTAEAYSMVVKK